MTGYIVFAILAIFAFGMIVYTMLNDPDSNDPKWDMDSAPWRKRAPWEK